jgi:hypothetical protein
MPLDFNHTERHVLENQGGYSRQLVDYWEKQGYVPSKHLLRVRDLIGRRVEDLLGADENGKGSAA